MASINIPVPQLTPPAVNPPPLTPPPVPVTIVDSTKNGVNVAQSGTTLTITDKGVVPPPIEIGIGSRVQAVGAVNVRSAAGGTLVGTQPNGATGTVIAGPTTANSFPWWQVTFDSAPSGWVGADSLELASNPNPPITIGAAFPGAQGSGASSVGGRGGIVIEVTNLNDSGAGSLRAALAASGPRTVVFRVAGLITSLSRLQLANPFCTIAGQTAPGGGIVLGGPNQQGEQLFVSTHDVIARYLTYDGNNPNTPTGPDTGTVGMEMASGNIYNVIFDHISCRWWGNKVFPIVSNDAGNVHETTVQWCLMAEPNAAHPVIIEYDTTDGNAMLATDNDFHHNFGINYAHRFPLLNIRSMRMVNNLSYNNLQLSGDFSMLAWGGLQFDAIGNIYKDGPQSTTKAHTFLFQSSVTSPDPPDSPTNPGPPSLYMLNNVSHQGNNTGGPYEPATTTPNDAVQQDQCYQGWEGGETPKDGIIIAPVPTAWYRGTPLAAPPYPIIATVLTDNTSLDFDLLATVGNSQMIDLNGNWVNRRDSVDARLVAQYQAGGPGMMFSGQWNSPAVAP